VRALLDVNVLLALFDSEHAHHARARAWWTENRDQGWASCPLTQNGFIRIMSSPGYPRPLIVANAISVLRAQVALAGHAFWPDDVSLLDKALFHHDRILGPRQLTDVYLLALAVKHGGRLATLDRAIPAQAVRGAEAQHVAFI
jgi:toxin-antitoxin system PIN domain toxin